MSIRVTMEIFWLEKEEDDEVEIDSTLVFFFKNPAIVGASREGGGWKAPICLSQWNNEDV